ncbi:hypothetical protein QBC35DRAFT_287156 [Podospora australis]|uniref:Avirulence Effector AvrLm4-7 domain-containing protein n=1 Tax=Podospora australis TaxID=1536484 RepID=A0AAN6WPJ7_9PEZI|nr:hypothetical protein QBC35DRAFT_287156 [Podospora australis]
MQLLTFLTITTTAVLAVPAALPLAARQHDITGPCPVTKDNADVCRDMIDSSGCWNGIIGANGDGNATNAERLWTCVPGGKKNMCECYGCDWGLDRFITKHQLCAEFETPKPAP